MSIVASEALLACVALPHGVVADALGATTLRGKQAPVALFALRREDPGAR